MLPPAYRLRRSAEFVAVMRHGRRASAGGVAVHLMCSASRGSAADRNTTGSVRFGNRPTRPDSPRVGFVVGAAVGGAVVRNRVRRRLRHLVGRWIGMAGLPPGSLLVVRALPVAARRTAPQLEADVRHALTRVLRAAA